jgi:hypothetical protein
MRQRLTIPLFLLSVTFPLLAQARPAAAAPFLAGSPYANAPVTAYVAARSDNSGTDVVWYLTGTDTCTTTSISTTNFIDQDVVVLGGPANDTLFVLWTSTLTLCGVPYKEPTLINGHYLDIRGQGGDDLILNPNSSFPSNLFGGDGNDKISSNHSAVIMDGENGFDSLLSHSSGGGESIYGGADDDCLSDDNAMSSVFDCGTHDTHDYVASGRVPATAVNCQSAVQVSFCNSP